MSSLVKCQIVFKKQAGPLGSEMLIPLKPKANHKNVRRRGSFNEERIYLYFKILFSIILELSWFSFLCDVAFMFCRGSIDSALISPQRLIDTNLLHV